MTIRLALVNDLLLTATNESACYDRFLETALRQQDGAKRSAGLETAAQNWTIQAGRFVRMFHRGDKPTPAETLAFAAELSAYYAEHLSEFGAEEIAKLRQRIDA